MPKPEPTRIARSKFPRSLVLTLAQRACYHCSNPDCRRLTSGPHSRKDKSLISGEAAHIFGANSGSARFDGSMSARARSEITNAIWLCVECHTVIDRDPDRYEASLLFRWKDEHDRYIASERSSLGDRLRYEDKLQQIEEFSSYPAPIRRILLDRPPAWEWRLTAELLRFLCRSELRKLTDLRGGLYTRPLQQVTLHEFTAWISLQLATMSQLLAPIEKILPKLLASWGEKNQPGDAGEILHYCLLIRDLLRNVGLHEEKVTFIYIPRECERVVELIKGIVASQAEKILQIPDHIEDAIAFLGTEHSGTVENPTLLSHEIVFEVPEDWEMEFTAELESLTRYIEQQIGL